jgi:nucleotide-binding universal stress UspA family protein
VAPIGGVNRSHLAIGSARTIIVNIYSIVSKYFDSFMYSELECVNMNAKIEPETKQGGLNTVLVALGPKDENRAEKLAEKAIDIAGPAGATVVLGHVFDEDEYDDTVARLGFDANGEVTPDDVAERYSAIRTLAATFEEAGVDYEVRGAVDDYGVGVTKLADDLGADMVVIGGRKRSPAGKAVFGSTAQEVMLAAPCPVTFVRADTE